MNTVFLNRDFIDLLKAAATTTGKPGDSPVSGQLLIEMDHDGVSVIGSNGRMETVARSEAYQGEACSFTLPAKKVLEITQALNIDENIRLKNDGDRIRLQAGKGRYTLASLPGDQFPRIAAEKAGNRFTVGAEVLCDALSRIAFAMASGDVRAFLNGALLEGCGDHLNLVATDGHRLLRYRIDQASNGDFQAILPREAVTALSKLCKTADGDISVELYSGHIRFEFGHMDFITKLVDGKFPDYRRVVPDADRYRVKCSREELLSAIKRARILANDKHPGIRFDFSTNLLRLSAHKDDNNECQEEVAVEYTGTDFTTGFNANILIEGLGALDSREIEIAFKDADAATLFVDSNLQNLTNVAMPMRV